VEGGETLLDDEIGLEDAIDIAKQAQELGLRSVKLTGGEPLVVSWVPEFIRFLSGNNIRVTMETNGTLITEKIARLFAECQVNFVGVSLDGATASTHEYIRCVPGCFERAINGLKNLKKFGIDRQILVAVHKGNLDELADIGRLAVELGIKSIKLNCVNDLGRGSDMVLNNETLDDEARFALFDSLDELERIAGVKYKLWMPRAVRSIRKMDRHTCGACDVIHCIGLLPNGDFALCGIGITTPDLIFGSFREHSMAEIWNTNPLISDLAAGLPDRLEGACAECVFKKACRGACRATAYVECGSIFGPDPICQRARDAGRFPVSRIFPTRAEQLQVTS
jgi:SynChlorMet cassette radical SAM/SPASM protein ScmF